MKTVWYPPNAAFDLKYVAFVTFVQLFVTTPKNGGGPGTVGGERGIWCTLFI
jgi:hypothetical protein